LFQLRFRRNLKITPVRESCLMLRSTFFRLSVWLSLLICGTPLARAEIKPEYLMDHDPEIQSLPPIRAFPPRLGAVWLAALARPEADMQRMSADAIARGRRAGVTELEAAVPRLVELLADKKSHPAVRVAAARALVALEARQTAPDLAEAARQNGADVRQVAEPALAEWRFEPFVAVWEARLAATQTTHHRDLILAILCLGTIGHEVAGDRLLEFVHEPLERADVRAAAARAAGAVRDRGLEPHARALMAGAAPPRLNRLCAVVLLTRHSGDEAQALLLKFAVDDDPAVAVVALQRLIEIDPHLALPVAEHAMQSGDARVRQRGADAYILVPNPDRMAVLSKLLDDPHPDVRRSVCSSLRELAQRPELDGPIREAAVQMLARDGWRGQEQAALLLGALDHEPSARRLQQLLDAPRAEVEIAAAWALKSLAIPETLPALFEKTQQRTAMRSNRDQPRDTLPAGIDHEVAHLFELFGKLKYAPAEPLLRQHVPKDMRALYSRSAAIWTLGHLHAGVPDDGLAAQFMERIKDIGPPPELHKVVIQCFIAIGRMKAVSQTAEVQMMFSPEMSSGEDSEVRRWVLMQLTGESIPELKAATMGASGWFLEPTD
jgi:HEAT repeat protein